VKEELDFLYFLYCTAYFFHSMGLEYWGQIIIITIIIVKEDEE